MNQTHSHLPEHSRSAVDRFKPAVLLLVFGLQFVYSDDPVFVTLYLGMNGFECITTLNKNIKTTLKMEGKKITVYMRKSKVF